MSEMFTTADVAEAIQNLMAVTNTEQAVEVLHDDVVVGQVIDFGEEPKVSMIGTRATFTIRTSDGRRFTIRVDED